jgi:hypothetical protein
MRDGPGAPDANPGPPLSADPTLIQRFVKALFRHADPSGHVSLRAFRDDANAVFAIESQPLAEGVERLVQRATALATRAARAPHPVVFAPPLASFRQPGRAAEADVQSGLALSVECDRCPAAARQKLEYLLGPATIIVASGGEWTDPETGEIEPKLHLHWRLAEPTRDLTAHLRLKHCRSLAQGLVGADATSNPLVHPMRWPGSWHRKAAPRLVRILAETDGELDLDEAYERLVEASGAASQATASSLSADATPPGAGEPRDTTALVGAILSAADYHAPLAALAMRYLKGGMPDAQTVLTLRGIMTAVPPAIRDLKDGVAQHGRWQARYDDIPRAVSTARLEIERHSRKAPQQPAQTGLEAVDRFRLDRFTEGPPPSLAFLLDPLMPLGKLGVVFGPGGVGKSLAMLQLCLLVAVRARGVGSLPGQPTLLGGTIPREAAGASIFLTLEDDAADIHRRIAALDPDGLRRDAPCFVMPLVELPDFDPAVVVAEGRGAALTEFATRGLDTLIETTAEHASQPVRLLVLDPAGDFLDGDENDAAFIKPLLRQLRGVAARHGCTIILLGHVAKALDAEGPTMRGSGAWIANSRFAYALWPPNAQDGEQLGRQVGAEPSSLVWGRLVKANHAGAPIGQKRLFARDPRRGCLRDVEARRAADGASDEQLLEILVEACAEHAAAGLPFSYSGVAGLWTGREDLPEPLNTLSKARLEALGKAALDAGRLVKVRNSHSQGAPKYLDKPDGPLAKGAQIELVHGSRREALARHRARGQA